jgi:intraflagellar transport protein 56
VDIIPEARLNLAIHHLRRNEIQEAHNLMKETQPTVPHEYILKGVVHAALGQEMGSVGIFFNEKLNIIESHPLF